MEARPRKDGTTAYRYHPRGGRPVALGDDKLLAIRRVLDMLAQGDDIGTVSRLWQQYQDTPGWRDLSPRTRADYTVYSVPLLKVFGNMAAADITAPMVARYLRVERGKAPTRANREVSLLGNLIGLAIERGECERNPCRGGQVARNKERPRTTLPARGDIAALAAYAQTLGAQQRVIVMAAEFAALTGARQVEMLRLHWPQFGADEVRLRRAKQRMGSEKVERIAVSPALLALRARLQAVAHEPTLGAVFPTAGGNPYGSSGFASMWGKLVRGALEAGVIARRFTFHDLRAHYATQHQLTTGRTADMHASDATTKRVYERSREARRDAL